MQLTFNILVIGALLCFGHAEVELKQGINQTVEFDGNELIIEVKNPQMLIPPFKICFGSKPDTDYEVCPHGFGGAWLNTLEKTKTYKLSRQGIIGFDQTVGGGIVFNADGTVNVVVVGMPSGGSVKLLNAKIPVVTTTTTTSTQDIKEGANNTAMIGIICGVVGLLLLLLIIGCVLLYFCWYKKQHHRIEIVPTDHQTYGDNVDVRESLFPKASVPHPRIRPASTTTTTPKLTSTSATKVSEERQQVTVAAKPTLIAPVASPAVCVSLMPASTQIPTPGTVLKQKSRKTKASKKSRRRMSTTSKTMQSDKPTEHSSSSPGYGDDRSFKRRSNDSFSGKTYSRQ